MSYKIRIWRRKLCQKRMLSSSVRRAGISTTSTPTTGTMTPTTWLPLPPPRSRTSKAASIRPNLPGSLYPQGIPIYAEEDLSKLIKQLEVDDCVFAYSDVPYQHVMSVGALVNAAGANFIQLGPKDTQVKSTKPVISVGAVRTGCGKSQTSRRIIEILMAKGLKVVAIRHPMPYGNIAAQKVQRFAALPDLDKHNCTVEEMEEYEPHVVRGNVIYAGVDYEAIVRAAEKDPSGCDVILWDGGNLDFPFYKSDLHVTVVDPHRPGHELTYYPGNVTLRLSDVVVINKMDSADAEGIEGAPQHCVRSPGCRRH